MPIPPPPDDRPVGVAVHGAPGVAVARRLCAAGYAVYVTGLDMVSSSFMKALVEEDGAVRRDGIVPLCRALGSEPLIWTTGLPAQTVAMARALHEARIRDVIVIIDGSTYEQGFDDLEGRAALLRGVYGFRCVAVSSGEHPIFKLNGDTDVIKRAVPVIMDGIRRR